MSNFYPVFVIDFVAAVVFVVAATQADNVRKCFDVVNFDFCANVFFVVVITKDVVAGGSRQNQGDNMRKVF